MSKIILFWTSIFLLSGCSDHGTVVLEEPISEMSTDSDSEINSADESEDEVEEINEAEDTELEEPIEPWNIYEDPFEVIAASDDIVIFTSADAPLLEDEVEKAFAEPIGEYYAFTTSKWSAFVYTFTLRMENEFSEEYINAMKQLNDSIKDDGRTGNVEKIQELVHKARTIRETE